MNQQSIGDLKPILGTANIGTKYGINSAISPEAERATNILNHAVSKGITYLDTAEGYEKSHFFIQSVINQIEFIDTKIFIVHRTSKEMEVVLEGQLRMFGESRVRRVLAHDWYKASFEERRSFVNICREYPRIEFGASLYSPDEFFEIIHKFPGLKSFQVPMSILDQRFLHVTTDNGYSSEFNFVIRSIFLQGALDWANQSNPFRDHPSITKISELAAATNSDLTTLVLAFLHNCKVREFVFGVTSEEQIDSLLDSAILVPTGFDFSTLASSELGLIDPRQWNT